jgi:hypothetical protein
MKLLFPTRLLLAGLPTVLIACGGGSGGGNEGGGPVVGIDRGGVTISQGPINGFGSVIVNGVRYSTTGAAITVDDRPGTESDLRVGQVVRVEGTVDATGTAGTARSIAFNDDVEGPVQSINTTAAQLVVLGQTVQVSRSTSFDDSISPRSLEGLAVGDRIEVSGLVNADGLISATRIERKPPLATVEVKGSASAVDSNARRFSISLLTVDYSTAQLSNFAAGAPVNGDLVEAHGSLDAAGVLIASRLERRSASLEGTTDDSADLEGLVTRFVSSIDFDVAGQRVTTTGTTVYEGGVAANLALGANVEVEGGFAANASLVATRIEFRRESDVEISALVDSVNAAAGSLVVLGATVRTNALTRFEDHSDADLPRFSLADLRAGDYVELSAYDDGSGLVASLLERDDADDRIEVEGPASAVAAPDFTVAGIRITTNDRTEFRNNDGGSISAATFFGAATGREVKVRGALVGNTVLAEEAELED